MAAVQIHMGRILKDLLLTISIILSNVITINGKSERARYVYKI